MANAMDSSEAKHLSLGGKFRSVNKGTLNTWSIINVHYSFPAR